MQKITLSQLHADPRNANVCSRETLDKIKRNIEATGQCPALIVRPAPDRDGEYILIDGYHRKLILEELGWTDVDCQVWEVSETQAAKALLTLNRLRGEDNRRKRAELVEELAQTIPLEELEMFLPEAVSELEDLLSILQLEEEEFERAIRKQIKDEEDSLPVPYGFMVPKADCAAVDASLAQFAVDGADPSQAFVKLCRAQLEGEVDHADIPSN